MKILIDECLDWRICRSLSDYYCVSVQKAGWAGLKNGELLERAQHEFDAFITSDRNLAFQQNTSKFNIAIIVLCAKSARLVDSVKLVPQIAEVLNAIQPGEVVQVFEE
jgi:predicted nuclease of predicted toxin-antitoxin system